MQYLQVIKIGTSSVFRDGTIDYLVLSNLGYDLAKLRFERETASVLVVSGAIPLGMKEKGITTRPSDPIELQSCARVGQTKLMETYTLGLKQGYGRYSQEKSLDLEVLTSQFLPTYHQLDESIERRNIVTGLVYDTNQGIIPLVNYNDGVDPSEVTRDNDTLAARLAKALIAGRLVILTDDGLQDAEGKLILKVSEVTAEIKVLCRDKKSDLSTGSMLTKLEAADLLLKEGIPTIIGNTRYGLLELIENERIRTIFTK